MLDAQRNRRLTGLFAEAAELAPAQRDDFVARTCAADPELAGELTALLRNLTHLDDFMGTPVRLQRLEHEPEQEPPPHTAEDAG